MSERKLFHRDYTRRPPKYDENRVMVTQEMAFKVATFKLSFVKDVEFREILIRLLIKEYHGNNSLFREHKKETEE
ncbi:hypothetical protein CMI37_02990 [Candidatus Pacearchaeota archaeon]|nr:hypothetical protein [Candidatus Pacearchaeota archaeon]|tara:strand:- start:12285 stop:12509 length:225 start_codon:yes stop_codon:yes gene_type:complete